MDEIERLREELANVRQSALQFDEERDRLRDKLVEVRAELAEANARRNDMRTALEWANGERDEARAKLEQCEKTKNGYVKQLDALSTAVTDALVKRIEPRLSRHPVTVVQHAGSVIGSIATVMGCEPDDGDDLVEAVRLLVAERDRLRERCETLANNHEYRVEELAARRDEHKAKREEYAAEARSLRERLKDAYRESDEARAELAKLREDYDSVLEANVSLLDGAPYVDARNAIRERDEARAEVEKLSESAKAAWEAECVMREQRDRYHAEWKQERQEVERWKRSCNVFRERDWPKAFQATVTSLEQEVSDAYEQLAKLRKLSKPWEGDAYRRGAEAMREACARWVDHWVSGHVADKLRDMPIPEEP